MHTRPLRILAILLFAGLVTTATGDTGVLKMRTSLRTQPIGSSPPLRMLARGEAVEILDKDSAARYYQVQTSDDDLTGWALKSAIDLTADTGGGPPPPVPGGPISSDWEKPAPQAVAYDSQTEGTCPATGDGGDTLTNTRKNRIDPLPTPHDVPWSAISGLSYPRPLPRNRTQWDADQSAQVAAFEGVALRTTGCLTNRVKVENEGGGESTNCHFSDAVDVDWHIYLVENAGDPIGKAVIVETTPRVRLNHHWDSAVLERWVNTNKPVRISGFLLLDQEHLSVVGTQRGTIWEIHPITKVEVCPSTACAEGDWVDLDGLP
jgi:hypothetical protein